MIVDLERVWIELTVSPTDLLLVREGQSVSVTTRGLAKTAAVTPLVIVAHPPRTMRQIIDESGRCPWLGSNQAAAA